MKIQPIPVLCTHCDHRFTGETVVEAPVDLFVASLNEIRCPSCGKGPGGLVLIQGEAKL